MTVKISPPTPSFEDEIRATMTTPQARSGFVDALGAKLMRQSSFVKSARVHRRPARLIWAAALAVLVLLIAGLLIIGPQRVLALVGSWFGYVPGVGYVQTNVTLRTLPAPQSVERDGITLTVEQVVADAQRTIVLYQVEGIQPKHRPVSEAGPNCGGRPYMRLPDGSTFAASQSGGGGWPGGYRDKGVFPALPEMAKQVTLIVPCLNDTKPGAAPEDWEIMLSLAPAPAGFDVRPVLEIPTQPAPATPLPAVNRGNIHANDVQLIAERVVDLGDGYLIEGTLAWQGNSTVDMDYTPYGGNRMTLVDATGRDIPIAVVQPDVTATTAQNQRRAWAVRTNMQELQSPLTLSLPSLRVMQPVQAVFDLDIGVSPEPGYVWQIDREVNLAGRTLHVLSATLVLRPGGGYDLELHSRVNPAEIADLSIWDADNHSARPSGDSHGFGDGVTVITINYDYLPAGLRRLRVPNISYVLTGPWEVSLNLPRANAPLPTRMAPPTTCLTAEGWQRYKAELLKPLPAGADGRILVAGPVQAGMMYPTLYVANLDGSQKTVIGPGGWASLSPDGKRVAYIYSDRMHVFDLETRQDTMLPWSRQNDYHPVLSPDGQRIAFNRDGIYTANLDGSDMRRVPGSTVSSALVGWMPDDVRLVVTSLGPDGSQLQIVKNETGAVENLFVFDNRKSQFAALSPDGRRVAFSEMLFGQPAYGLYVANLDGTGKRLVASAGADVFAVTAAWSPDGERLLVSGFELNSASTVEEWSGFVVQPETCQMDHLPAVDGEVLGWK